MLSGKLILNVLAISAFEIAGQMFIKNYYEQDDRKLYLFLLGWLMYLGVIYFLFRIYFLSNFALANVIWNSITTILITIIGLVYYKEKLTKYEMVGIGVIVIGFLIIGFFSDGDVKEAA